MTKTLSSSCRYKFWIPTLLVVALCIQASKAIACDPGTFDNGSGACSSCDTTKCLECDASATTCTACPEGKYLSSSACSTCPTGCGTCRDASVCMTCKSGYVLAGSSCPTEAQARSNNTTSSGLAYGWIIAITAGGLRTP